MPYGRNTYAKGRIGGGYGIKRVPAIRTAPPVAMSGAAFLSAAGTRVIHSVPMPIVGAAQMEVTLVVSVSLSGDFRLNMAPSGYIRVAVPPVSPASVGIENAYIDRVSVIMGQPTIDANTGRPN